MITILDTIKESYSSYDLGYQLKQSFIAGLIAGIHKQDIEKFEKMFPNKPLNISSEGIVFSNPSRSELMDFLQCFGDNWKKELEDYYPDKIKYVQEFSIGDGEITYIIKASMAEPPPSCVIEEVEELVPASVRKVRKMVCPKNEDLEPTPITEEPL